MSSTQQKHTACLLHWEQMPLCHTRMVGQHPPTAIPPKQQQAHRTACACCSARHICTWVHCCCHNYFAATALLPAAPACIAATLLSSTFVTCINWFLRSCAACSTQAADIQAAESQSHRALLCQRVLHHPRGAATATTGCPSCMWCQQLKQSGRHSSPSARLAAASAQRHLCV